MSVADQVALDLCGEHVTTRLSATSVGTVRFANAPFSSATRKPFTSVPASQVTARSSPWGWMRKELRLPSWIPPSPPNTTTSKPSAALALGRSGRNANAASKAREGLMYFSPCERSNLPDRGIEAIVREGTGVLGFLWGSLDSTPWARALTLREGRPSQEKSENGHHAGSGRVPEHHPHGAREARGEH